MIIGATATTEILMGALLDAGVRGVVLFVLAGGAAWLLRPRAAAVRHAVWFAALALQLVLPIAGMGVPRWNVAVLPTQPVETRGAPAAPRSPSDVVVSPVNQIRQASTTSTARLDATAAWNWSAPRIVLAVWMIGAMAILLRLLVGSIRVSRLALRAKKVTDGRWLTLASNLSTGLRIRRPVTLLRGNTLSIPITWGVVYPVVLLPDDADAWSDERRRSVLVHEMAHVKRLDAVTQLIGQLALAAFWFNPLAWLAARRMQLEREHACDDYVLRHGSKPSAYASDLLEIVQSIGARGRWSEAPAFAALAMARRSEFEGRMLSILDPSIDRKPINRKGVFMSTAAALLLVMPLAAFTPIAKQTASAPIAKQTTPAPIAKETTPPPRIASDSPQVIVPIAKTIEEPVTVAFPAVPRFNVQMGKCDGSWSSRSGTSSHIQINSDRPGSRVLEFAAMSPSRCIESRLTGEVIVSDDESEVTDVPGGATVFIRERTAAADRQVSIVGDRRGGLTRTYTVNGSNAAYDDAARRWFAGMLPMVLRETSVDAPKRVARLRREGGVSRVLSMISSMFTTGGRGSHYEALLSDGSLSLDELERTLRQARIDLASSSGDLSAVLSKVPVSQITSTSAREALGAALSSIESDGDKARTIAEVILHADADELLLVAARAARTIESDGDKSRLLMATAARYLGARSEVLRSAYFDVAESVQSEGDKRRVLTTAAPYGHADQGVTLAVIRATTGMESSGEQAAVLTTLASQHLIVTPALRDAYLRAADRIESEGDRSRVLRAAREP